MNALKVYLLVVLTFCSCNSKNEEKKNDIKTIIPNSSKKRNPINELDYYVEGDSIATKASEGLPQLSYKFNVDSEGYLLKSIFVYSDLIKVQEILANKDIESKEFRLVDWNFDGYKDISILYNCGSGGCAYWIWNYSPKTKKYYYNKKLSAVIGLEIDTVSKFVIFHYRGGYESEFWDTLRYENNKLIFVKGLYQERWNDTLGNSWTKRTYKSDIDNRPTVRIDSFMVK